LRENDSSGISDSRLHYGRPQTAHTAAKITKVKDLALIFRSVFLSSKTSSGKKYFKQTFCP